VPEADVPAFVLAIYDSAIATSIRESDYLFPILQTFHALGVMLMVGSIGVLDLRIMGALLKARPAAQVGGALLPLTWIGFAVMLFSGGLLLAAQVGRIYGNDFLRIKLALLLAAGLNGLVFHLTTYRSIDQWGDAAPVSAKAAAALSLALWAAIVITGRYIAYY